MCKSTQAVSKGLPGPVFAARMLKFQRDTMEALFAASVALDWALMSGGHSDWLPEVRSVPHCVSGAEDGAWHIVSVR